MFIALENHSFKNIFVFITACVAAVKHLARTLLYCSIKFLALCDHGTNSGILKRYLRADWPKLASLVQKI